jgi:short subunit dehydrogenase-like uncharacterized protein
MNDKLWMIYGAYGYTGKLIAEEAVRRGHKIILAGRSKEKLILLAEALGFEYVVINLDDPDKLNKALQNVELVFHAAGPFAQTCEPMVQACLQTGRHYLDSCGEVGATEIALSYGQQAREMNSLIMPGAAFAVIATDCLANHVTRQLDHPTHLEIATSTSITTNPSPGTAKSAIFTMADGTLVRKGGQLVRIPQRGKVKQVHFMDQERFVLPTSIGDLVTAYHSTGIPNITTYMAFPEKEARSLARSEPLMRNLLSINFIRNFALKQAEKNAPGPKDHSRQSDRSYVWASARDEAGNQVQAWLETMESYRFTAVAAVRCVEKVLAGDWQGALTPALAFGPDFVLEIPETARMDHLVDNSRKDS